MTMAALRTYPRAPQEHRPHPQLIWECGSSLKWLSLPPFTKKKITLFLLTLHDPIILKIPPSPTTIAALGTTPRAPQECRLHPQYIWERGALLKWLSLTPHNKKNLFLSMLCIVMDLGNTLKIPPSPVTIAALGTPHPTPQEH